MSSPQVAKIVEVSNHFGRMPVGSESVFVTRNDSELIENDRLLDPETPTRAAEPPVSPAYSCRKA
jgi:hypothetical protein